MASKLLLQILALFIPLTQNWSPGKASVIAKAQDSSTHPVTWNSQIMLILKLWALLVPFHSCQPLKRPSLPTVTRQLRPAHELQLLAQPHSSPGSAQDPQLLGSVGPSPKSAPRPARWPWTPNHALGAGAPNPKGLTVLWAQEAAALFAHAARHLAAAPLPARPLSPPTCTPSAKPPAQPSRLLPPSLPARGPPAAPGAPVTDPANASAEVRL